MNSADFYKLYISTNTVRKTDKKKAIINKTHLTSVTVDSFIALRVYLPRPWVNFNDLYNLLNRAVQYLLYFQ
jgi:hypothetical protein